MARRDAWLQELREHRVTHRQSRFRWWSKDVMAIATWTTWGRVDFTELNEERLDERIAAQRAARAGPNDPRRVLRQTFT